MNRRAIDRFAVVPSLTISVTKQHIDTACRRNSQQCMIHDAIAEAYPRFRRIRVDTQSIRVTDPKKGYRYAYFTPQKGQKAIIAFDRGAKVTPFTMSLSGTAEGIAQPLARTRTVKKRRSVASVGAAVGIREAGWRDPRKRSGKHLPNRSARPKRFTVKRKFGLCLLGK